MQCNCDTAVNFNRNRELAMFRRTAGFLTLVLAVGVGSVSAQGTFGHLAYGGGWQTTFLLVNQDRTTEADASLSLYSDSGAPLAAPVNGGKATAVFSFTIPPSGSAAIVLPDTGGSTTREGWANLIVSNSPSVSGQAIFRQQLGGSHPVLEAAVPFSTGAPLCLVPYGEVPLTHFVLVPFDNTVDLHVTAFAFANTTSAGMAIPIEFDDASGAVITTDTINLGALNHTAFTSTAKYPETNNKTGVLRITLPGGSNPGDLSVLALLADSSAGTLTTLLPITQ